ncbi:hypothetical protein BH09PSE2_BH09PSE2_11750 [soil metagenome]
MIKTILTTTTAFALMTGMAFAQAKTDGGTMRSTASPTSGNSGATLSTGQTQPLPQGAYSSQTTVGQNSVNGTNTGGPTPPGGAADTGQSVKSVQPTTGSGTMPTSTMPASGSVTAMPSTPTMIANTPTGDAPSAYPRCSKRGQDRCKSMR